MRTILSNDFRTSLSLSLYCFPFAEFRARTKRETPRARLPEYSRLMRHGASQDGHGTMQLGCMHLRRIFVVCNLNKAHFRGNACHEYKALCEDRRNAFAWDARVFARDNSEDENLHSHKIPLRVIPCRGDLRRVMGTETSISNSAIRDKIIALSQITFNNANSFSMN